MIVRCDAHAQTARLSFFFHNPATPEIYTLSLHDALPIYNPSCCEGALAGVVNIETAATGAGGGCASRSSRKSFKRSLRSEEHTSELQSHVNLVCRLLLEKKNTEYCRLRLIT